MQRRLIGRLAAHQARDRGAQLLQVIQPPLRPAYEQKQCTEGCIYAVYLITGAEVVPDAVWIHALMAAAPLPRLVLRAGGTSSTRIDWQRMLASLACTSTFFRRLLKSAEADCLYAAVAIAGTSPTSGVALVAALSTRAQAIKRLEVDCAAIDLSQCCLLTFLESVPGLQSLVITSVDDAASAMVTSGVCSPRLPGLQHLACIVSGQDASMRTPHWLPRTLTSLEVAVPSFPGALLSDPNVLWHWALVPLRQLQSLSLHIVEPSATEVEAEQLLQKLNRMGARRQAFSSLSQLCLTHHIFPEDSSGQSRDAHAAVRFFANATQPFIKAVQAGLLMENLTRLTLKLLLPCSPHCPAHTDLPSPDQYPASLAAGNMDWSCTTSCTCLPCLRPWGNSEVPQLDWHFCLDLTRTSEATT